MKKIRLIQLIIVACVFIISSCSKDDIQPEKPKSYVLVHGAWQAPFVWQTVKTNLEKQGNKVVVVELTGHGSNYTSPSTITAGLDSLLCSTTNLIFLAVPIPTF